ncbi:glycosyltransferase family 4 protein [Serratia grimesii]|uniref:glycosyltransferase family 4 protein n=1 Tax=Serratia grimesii TaxID=82995 RepID=UPI00223F47AE|nr:glycosyltransferase family 4 protein [Serratia grimesii]
MKIMLINTLYYPNKVGGAEVSVQLLAEELVKAGHSVSVLTLHDGKNRKVDKINGVDVVYLPLRNLYWPFSTEIHGRIKKLLWHVIDNYNFAMARSIGPELAHFAPDIVHTNNISGFSVAIWRVIKKYGAKLVHTSRDYYLFHPNSTMYSSSGDISPKSPVVKLWSLIKRHASNQVDVYVGISKFIKYFHQENGFFANAKSDYIYNPVENVLFNKTKSKTIRVGFIGRLTRDKGFDEFCHYVTRLKSTNPEVQGIAAGRFNSGEEQYALEKLAADSDVVILGFVSLNVFLSSVDVVVLPVQWREPFGRVIVECVFAEKLVLTNAAGGVSELAVMLPNVQIIDNSTVNLSEIRLAPVKQEIIELFSRRTIAKLYSDVYNS